MVPCRREAPITAMERGCNRGLNEAMVAVLSCSVNGFSMLPLIILIDAELIMHQDKSLVYCATGAPG